MLGQPLCSHTLAILSSGLVSWKLCFLWFMEEMLPTGGGKTLCMFVPPLAMSPTAIGLIISLLVALIDQQISAVHV